MKTRTFAVAILALLLPALAVSQQSAAPADCGAAKLVVENGKVSVTEEGKTTEIPADSKNAKKAKAAAARTTCRSGGGYTVCSNGRYGCVWSDRSGKLLGCGGGI